MARKAAKVVAKQAAAKPKATKATGKGKVAPRKRAAPRAPVRVKVAVRGRRGR